MASHRELSIDWSMLDNDCNNWTVQDFQLAAELAQTLLDRNGELEAGMQQQQELVDDQALQIEFLNKQVASLKEQSTTTSKSVEILESSISELEKTNEELTKKQEVDKHRIKRLTENLDFLERKCEELNSSLELMKSEQEKKPLRGASLGHPHQHPRSIYSSLGAGSGSGGSSEEEEMSSIFGLGLGVRKRAHSLQDLRDYTPSPDEFDSGNSNSPDLKASESEFIESLESRIEELTDSRKKTNEKVVQLEAQVKTLNKENRSLQQQLMDVSTDKDNEIQQLKKMLEDLSSNYHLHDINTSFEGAFVQPLSSTGRNSTSPGRDPCFKFASSRLSIGSSVEGDQVPLSTSALSCNAKTGVWALSPIDSNKLSNSAISICQRCSSEIQVHNLLHSVEDWDFADGEEDLSSLEHELAKATGTSGPYHHHCQDNRSLNYHYAMLSSPSSNSDQLAMSMPLFGRSESLGSSHNTSNNLEKTAEQRQQISDGTAGTIKSLVAELTGAMAKVNKSKPLTRSSSADDENESSGSSEERLDEEPCLVKDRKPEIAKSSKGKKAKGQRKPLSSLAHQQSSSSNKNGCEEIVRKKNPKLLPLPKRISTDDDEEDQTTPFIDPSVAVIPGGQDTHSGDQEGVDEIGREVNEEPTRKLMFDFSNAKTQNEDEEESCKSLPPSITLSYYSPETLATSTEQIESNSHPTSSESLNSLSSTGSASSSSSSHRVPKYKRILSTILSVLTNSQRKYPYTIPMYPLIQAARSASASQLSLNRSD